MPRILLIILFAFTPFVCGEEKGWKVYFSEEGWVSISGKHLSGESLTRTIGLVPDDTWLRYFRVFPSEDDAELQADIHNFLALNYSDLHNEALMSAGNMHNPKVKALGNAFQEAIMASGLVTRINTLLKQRCERITSTSYEKFTIFRKSNGEPIYSAMVWLKTEKCI